MAAGNAELLAGFAYILRPTYSSGGTPLPLWRWRRPGLVNDGESSLKMLMGWDGSCNVPILWRDCYIEIAQTEQYAIDLTGAVQEIGIILRKKRIKVSSYFCAIR